MSLTFCNLIATCQDLGTQIQNGISVQHAHALFAVCDAIKLTFCMFHWYSYILYRDITRLSPVFV